LSEVYSHSRLASFEKCPKQFHFRYVLRIPAETESIEAYAGKRVHEVLERLYLAIREGRVPSLKRVIERFRALWHEQFDKDRLRIARAENGPDVYRENGERCLSNHYLRNYPFDGDETIGVEQRVSFALDARGAYRVQGVIDRIVRTRQGEIEIHDFKTARRIPRQSELDQDRQLALYQLGLSEQLRSEKPVRLVWHYLLSDQVRSSTRTPEALEQLRRDTIGAIDRIRAETRFQPRPGPLCRWCEYAGICPESGMASAAPLLPIPPPLPPLGQLRLF
jgi:putative RecB family exonuclease